MIHAEDEDLLQELENEKACACGSYSFLFNISPATMNTFWFEIIYWDQSSPEVACQYIARLISRY
jgi:hypothetical protein